jgi:hypothetical protein
MVLSVPTCVRVLLRHAEKPLPALPLDKVTPGTPPGDPSFSGFPMGVELGTFEGQRARHPVHQVQVQSLEQYCRCESTVFAEHNLSCHRAGGSESEASMRHRRRSVCRSHLPTFIGGEALCFNAPVDFGRGRKEATVLGGRGRHTIKAPSSHATPPPLGSLVGCHGVRSPRCVRVSMFVKELLESGFAVIRRGSFARAADRTAPLMACIQYFSPMISRICFQGRRRERERKKGCIRAEPGTTSHGTLIGNG